MESFSPVHTTIIKVIREVTKMSRDSQSYLILPSPSLEMSGCVSRPTLNTAFDLVHERTEPVRGRDITWAAPGTFASIKHSVIEMI